MNESSPWTVSFLLRFFIKVDLGGRRNHGEDPSLRSDRQVSGEDKGECKRVRVDRNDELGMCSVRAIKVYGRIKRSKLNVT